MGLLSGIIDNAAHGQTVGAVFSVFLLIFVGYGAKKIRLFKAEDGGLLGSVVLYIALPAFVFDAIYNYHGSLPVSLWKVPAIGFAVEACLMVLAYLLGRALRLNRPTLGGFILASTFGNTGFLGYPVIQAAFKHPSAMITAVLYDEIGMALPLYTIGMIVAAGFAGEKTDFRQAAKAACSPAIWVIPIAFILRPYHLATPVTSAIHYLANGTVPLSMLTLGLYLSTSSMKGMALPILATCALKLVVLPTLTFYAAKAGGISGIMHSAMIVEAGTPTAVMSCVVASKYGANERFVAGIIFASTILCMLTIPAALVILGVPGN